MAKKKSTTGAGEKNGAPALPGEVGSKVTAATAASAMTATAAASGTASAELPFSEMISRWLDDGDRLHETGHAAAADFGAEVAGHQGRLHLFVENARAQAHRHRRLLGGAALLAVILAVVAFRHANTARALATDAHPTIAAVVAPRNAGATATTTGGGTTTAASLPDPGPTATATVTATTTTGAAAPLKNEMAKEMTNETAEAPVLPTGTMATNGTERTPHPDPLLAERGEGTRRAPDVAAATALPADEAPQAPAAAPAAAAAKTTSATEVALAPPATPSSSAPTAAAGATPSGTLAAAAVASPPARPEKAARPDDSAHPTAEPGAAAATAPTTVAAAPAPRKPRPAEPALGGAGATAPPLELCKSALLRQRPRDALAACRQVFGGDPHSADAMLLLARADLLAGRPTETLELARRAVATDPRKADAYLLIGTIEQTTGQRQDARAAYETYLKLSPYGAHASDVRAILRTL